MSAGNLGLIGIRDPNEIDDSALQAQIRAAPCAALFRDVATGPVPMALFSDFNCPNCDVFDRAVTELNAANPGMFQIIRHQLPLLGVRPDIVNAVAKSKAIAKVFGLYGTPAAVIGTSVTLGTLSRKELTTIIKNEKGYVCN